MTDRITTQFMLHGSKDNAVIWAKVLGDIPLALPSTGAPNTGV